MEAIALIVIVLLAIYLQKYLFTKFAFQNLHYHCKFSTREAFEGDQITLTESIHNNKALPLQWLKVELKSSRWLSFANTSSHIAQEIRYVTSGYFLRHFQRTTRIWNVTCQKRGVFRIKNATLVSSDFFGLDTKSIAVPINEELIVFPSPVCLEEVILSTKTLQGDTIVKRWTIEDPFIVSGAREYTSFDSFNKVHWKATARVGQLMVKKNDFTSSQSIRVILNIQTVSYYHPETIEKDLIEYGIKIAATIFEKAQVLGIPTSFTSNGPAIDKLGIPVATETASGLMHTKYLMSILAQLDFKIALGFHDLLENTISQIDNNDIIVITSYLDEELVEKLNRLKDKCTSVKVIMLKDNFYNTGLNNEIGLFLASPDTSN